MMAKKEHINRSIPMHEINFQRLLLILFVLMCTECLKHNVRDVKRTILECIEANSNWNWVKKKLVFRRFPIEIKLLIYFIFHIIRSIRLYYCILKWQMDSNNFFHCAKIFYYKIPSRCIITDIIIIAIVLCCDGIGNEYFHDARVGELRIVMVFSLSIPIQPKFA